MDKKFVERQFYQEEPNLEGSNAYIYIVFSNTPYKMGRFIRAVTHATYNHVSVAMDGELKEMYSFARLKRDTPFCGGFVQEGAERFRHKDRKAELAVCRVHVGEEGVERVREKIRSMKENRDTYLYNMLSAMLVPCRKTVQVRDSYTCVEFANAVLRLAGIELSEKCFSAAQLYELLRDREVYHGEFPDEAAIADATYCDRVSVPRRIGRSFRQFGRLLRRLFSRKQRNSL